MWKATIRFVMSVRLSAWNTSAPTGRIYMKFCIRVFSTFYRENSSFIKLWQEYHVLYIKTNVHFLSYLPHFFLEWEMFQKVLWRKSIHTFYFQYLFPENRAVYGIMLKNTEEPDRSQTTLWRMRIAYGILLATDTSSECVIFIAFHLRQWLYKRTTMLRPILPVLFI